MANEYPNSGALFTPKYPKKHDNAPDFNGNLTIQLDLLEEIMQSAEGDEVTIKLDGWKRKDKNGNHMVSIKVNTYKPPQAPKGTDPWDD